MTADAFATIALLLSLATAIGGVIAWAAARAERRRTQQTEAYRAVHLLYDQMVRLRFEHPEFQRMAHEWTPCRMASAYAQKDADDLRWAQYCTYVELCIGFANAVLQARDSGAMGAADYSRQWKRLVLMVVAEHYLILSDLAENGPYLSEHLRVFMEEEQSDPSWDWTDRHRALAWKDRSTD